MGNELEVEVAKEVTKQIAADAYQDAIKPIAKPAGELGGLLIRAIKASLAPLEKWTLMQEYNIAMVEKLLAQLLDKIDINVIKQPEPYIAVPTMLYLSYCMDTDDLRDMYANLLAKSMIDVVREGVHPGFVEIIKQLSPDDAKVLKYMFTHDDIPTIGLRYSDAEGNMMDIVRDFSDVGEKANCDQSSETEKIFDNLIRLGLISKSAPQLFLAEKEIYEPLKRHPVIIERKGIEKEQEHRFISEEFVEGFMRMTSFGKAFCEICVSPPGEKEGEGIIKNSAMN